ncbi:hypothetical protein P3G55_04615 [Leptospira sp. 96542]|nr:hypothetical protein [Leptospira sp. 96542]
MKRWQKISCSILALGLVAILSIMILRLESTGRDCDLCKQIPSLESGWVLLYPGLVGCSQKCPLALANMAKLKEGLVGTKLQFYYLISDPFVEESEVIDYLLPYQNSLSIKPLMLANDTKTLRTLGVYNPVHPNLQKKDIHNDHFILIPPNRKKLYFLGRLDLNSVSNLILEEN